MQTKKSGYIAYITHHTHLNRDLIIGAIDSMICLCCWEDSKTIPALRKRLTNDNKLSFKTETNAVLQEAASEIDRYFNGEITEFSVPQIEIGTEFMKRVWAKLREIPHGQTVTYKQIAQKLGRPTATRAVANAIGNNPLMIIIPCHRVIGSDNTLTGYAGGLDIKHRLLLHEGVNLIKRQSL